MPKFQFEAMDSKTGAEVTDTIEAPSEAEAQSLIREKGLYVTKITESGKKKAGKTAAKKTCLWREEAGLHPWENQTEKVVYIHAATFDVAGCWASDFAKLANPGRSIQAGRSQKHADECDRGC